MSKQVEFDALVEEAIRQGDLANLRPVVEKELLHYDILFCLSEAGLLKSLTFQGGTSLRLCYSSNRFSEDLDFAGGPDFCSANLAQMKDCIEDYLGKRYGLEVTVKEPNELRAEPEYAEVKVDKWQISVTTAPERKDLPRQRIKIEVANIPAYTHTWRQLVRNYTVLPDGYSDTLIRVETLEEVMADKLVSFPATTNRIRYRDMWDLIWLKQQGATINANLVSQKLKDYKIDAFEKSLQARIDSLPNIIIEGNFHNEMKRFIPSSVYETSLEKEGFSSFLLDSLKDLLNQLRKELYPENDKDNLFQL
ncbi:TPA: nucleotidyl transferase AbiEii/AbiGii toxin family protein [Salmonella enterica]|nr:nucleotidyl transferase AbiEii/AbiGii toxin family protein [Salmonella enterica]EJO0240653.1 nucleotidyl transferase AbiEii/AbiGii toxin family protein [Salmonella enterica]HCT5113235.1 nucleotidyl transferase AbiEii/AbiGii toxin family protein [Salmonella enterica]